MTIDEKRAYARGYATGLGRKYPAHRPPLPPDSPLVRALMESLTALADAVDSICATFDPDDLMATDLMPHVDVAREAMAAITEHLRATT